MKHEPNILRMTSAWKFVQLCSTRNHPLSFINLLCLRTSFKLVTSYSIHYDLQRWRKEHWFCTLGFSQKIQYRNCKQITKDSGFCCSRRTVHTPAFLCLYQELYVLSLGCEDGTCYLNREILATGRRTKFPPGWEKCKSSLPYSHVILLNPFESSSSPPLDCALREPSDRKSCHSNAE